MLGSGLLQLENTTPLPSLCVSYIERPKSVRPIRPSSYDREGGGVDMRGGPNPSTFVSFPCARYEEVGRITAARFRGHRSDGRTTIGTQSPFVSVTTRRPYTPLSRSIGSS